MGVSATELVPDDVNIARANPGPDAEQAQGLIGQSAHPSRTDPARAGGNAVHAHGQTKGRDPGEQPGLGSAGADGHDPVLRNALAHGLAEGLELTDDLGHGQRDGSGGAGRGASRWQAQQSLAPQGGGDQAPRGAGGHAGQAGVNLGATERSKERSAPGIVALLPEELQLDGHAPPDREPRGGQRVIAVEIPEGEHSPSLRARHGQLGHELAQLGPTLTEEVVALHPQRARRKLPLLER